MPIFEYRCNACGKQFEELVFADTKVACPACQGKKVTKQLSVPAPPVAARSAAVPACEGGPPSSCCGGGACQLN
ncbi:MAG: zinc ribbon domain-containing protein [Gemmatimonadales bacterium]